MKACSKCKVEKPLDQFSKDSTRKDGTQRHCKECNRKAGEKYRAANPEKRRAVCESWSARNPAKRREYSKRYDDKNREKVAERRALYRKNNADKLKQWQSENKETRRANEARRRSRKRESGGAHTADDVKALLTMQKGRCACCKCDIRKNYHVDHVVPLARGGSNDRLNLQLLCPTCNQRKHARDPIDWMQSQGYLL
ncbi:HNH endonuclease signature motif containing protein [Burkholderia ubonensis]|uniref:HNH endonuclease signature motif containing protein n=1 Tax=Burkholderia ubonensis TaxID=101571 RepID=UPI0012F72580|nr:HNH endonuclease [Burkholderia ubonensis]